jgi:hypothetical protein
MNAYIKNTERSEINDMLHLKLLEKQEQAEPKTSSRKIIKIRAEINERQIKNTKESTKQRVFSLKRQLTLINP